MLIPAYPSAPTNFGKSRGRRDFAMPKKNFEPMKTSSPKPPLSWWAMRRISIARFLLRSARWLALIIAPELKGDE